MRRHHLRTLLLTTLLALAPALPAAPDPAALDAARALYNQRGKSAEAQNGPIAA